MISIFRIFQRKREERIYMIRQFSVFFLIWSISFALFEYFAPLYLESLGISFVVIGIILSGSSFISFFIDPLLGHLQKRFHPKILLLVSIILFFINIFLFISSKNVVFLLFLATNIYGIAFDLFSITSSKTIFKHSIEGDRSTNLSILGSFYSLGLLIGAVIAGIIIGYSLKNPIYLCFGMLLFLFFIILISRGNIDKENKDKKLCFSGGYKYLFYELKTLGAKGIFLIVFLIFIHLFDGFFFVFEPIFAKKFEGNIFSTTIIGGILLAIYTLPVIFFSFFFGKMADKFGRKKFVALGLFIAAISLFLLQSSDNLIISAISIFFASMGFYAIALHAIEGIYESLSEKKFGADYRGCSAGIMEITLSVGFLFGPLLGGIFISMPNGFNFAFRIFGILTLIMVILSFFLPGKKTFLEKVLNK